MKIYSLKSSKSSLILDNLEKTILLVLDGEWKVIRKSKLMSLGVLIDYGVLEFWGRNVKFENDEYYLKIFYEVWGGEYNGYGVGKPKNIPIYRGFIEGKRKVSWPIGEDIGTHRDKYGDFGKLVDIGNPDRVGMVEVGHFDGFSGELIDLGKMVNSMIANWGKDSGDFDIDEIPTNPIPVNKMDLVSV